MSSPRSPARMVAAAAAIAVVVCSAAGRAETISPDSWVYDALRSFETRGLVRLEPTLPYTFDECERYAREIAAAVERERISLGPRHRFLLDRLTMEFVGKAAAPRDRYDGPVGVVGEGGRWAVFDATVGGALLKSIDEEEGEANGIATPSLIVDLGHRLTFETEYRLVMGPERGNRAHGGKPTYRTRSYHGLVGEFTRGLVAMNGEWWEARVGREYLQWGRSRTDGLTVSRSAGSFDHFGGSFDIGRFTLSTFQASLDPYTMRHLAGHRLTVGLPRGIFLGIGETVVYCRREFDWKYLTPIGFFYAHQYNEGMGNEDNIVWSIDCTVPVARNLLVHGEILVDDIQYERGEESGPDKLGFDVAAEGILMIAGRELELGLGYTRLNAYMYGHSGCSGYYAGPPPVAVPSPLIGGETLGPDADRLSGSASLGISRRVVAGVRGSYERYGGLSRRYYGAPPDWYPWMDNDLPFPSDPVTADTRFLATFRYDLDGGSYVAAEAGERWRDVEGGPDESDPCFRIELALDL